MRKILYYVIIITYVRVLYKIPTFHFITNLKMLLLRPTNYLTT